MGEHRFVVLVVDHRAQRAVRAFFEERVERQGLGFGRIEGRPVVVQQDVAFVAGYAAARRVLMVERQEGVLRVGHRFEEGVAEERLVEGQFVQHLTQRFVAGIGPFDQRLQPGSVFVADHPLARDVVGLVVDDAAVGGRAAGHERQRAGEQVVVAPAPELVVLHLARAHRHVGVRSRRYAHRRSVSLFFLHVVSCFRVAGSPAGALRPPQATAVTRDRRMRASFRRVRRSPP